METIVNRDQEIRPNLSGSHTFSLTATAEIGRKNVIFKAKRKLSLISGYTAEKIAFLLINCKILVTRGTEKQTLLLAGYKHATIV